MATPKRRAKGTGSIFWNKKRRRYIGKVPMGRNLDGSTHYVTVSDKSEAVCAAKMREARTPGPRTTVAEWSESWFKELTIRASSRDDYRHTLDQFILPTLGHLPVAGLTAHQVEAAIKKWTDRLGPNTTRKNFGHLRACLEAARRAGLIVQNPARDARRPRPKKSHVDPFTPAELDRIIQTGPGIFVLLASIGCRIGEALALDVGDFNRSNGWVSITKTYTRKHGIRRPKSENGIREVRVPSQAMPAIQAAAGTRTHGPLFLSRAGERGEHRAIRYQWVGLLRKLGYRYRRLHQLRHSVATIWVENGVSVMAVAKRLGDTVEVVVKTYLHDTGQDPSDAFERALGSNKVSGTSANGHFAHRIQG